MTLVHILIAVINAILHVIVSAFGGLAFLLAQALATLVGAAVVIGLTGAGAMHVFRRRRDKHGR